MMLYAGVIIQSLLILCSSRAAEATNVFNNLLPLPAAAAAVAEPRRSENENQRIDAVNKLKQLVPPPTRSELGCGDHDAPCDQAYARFLSVSSWNPTKTASKIDSSFQWRKRIKPHTLRPHHCPTLSRQHAWLALTTGPGSRSKEDLSSYCYNDETNNNNAVSKQQQKQKQILPMDPPHTLNNPLQSWRRTKHGLPITYFRCWMWKPSEASNSELEKHMAYHVHHLLRRLPPSSNSNSNNSNTKNNVSRICVIFDMRGFEHSMLPYIHRAINVLRLHYPGRAGAMCFINCPTYFTTVWKIIKPWLDEEIRSKTFFAPKGVNDVEKCIDYLNKMKLKVGPV